MRIPRRHPAAVLIVLAAALVVAGCGGSSSSGSGGSSGNGVASKSPRDIVSTAANALDQVHSFHLDGSGKIDGRPATLSGDVSIPGRMSLTVREGPAVAQIIAIQKNTYLKANKGFWAANANNNAATIAADRWIAMPPGSFAQSGLPLSFMSSKTLGHCALESHLGTLTNGGSTDFHGRQAVIVVDQGDVPGATPGKLYVATTGQPLPLAVQQTGPMKPGGKPDPVCHETQSDVSGNGGGPSLVTFSDYNAPVTIDPPKGAVSIQSLLGQASG